MYLAFLSVLFWFWKARMTLLLMVSFPAITHQMVMAVTE
jgi:hypothetical protein